MLSVNDLVTSYGLIKALRNVSLEAEKGKLTCILGPNGAGKSTLLFTIAGILKSDNGSIKFLSKEISKMGTPNIVKEGLVLVPENRLVFPHLTVRENLLTGAYSRFNKKIEIAEDVEAMYRRFPILKERYLQESGTLSGGEQQMLAVARALMARPKLLLMDEPSVGLAPKIVNTIFEIIKALSEEGISIVLVEQNAVKASAIADHIYLLDQGEITFSGTPDQIEDNDIIKRAYLGDISES
jgi:branched-chain amino acid transport system ATP-binding protein